MKKIILSVLALAISGVLTVNAQQEPKKEAKKHETIKEEVKEKKEDMKEKKEERKEKKEEKKKEEGPKK